MKNVNNGIKLIGWGALVLASWTCCWVTGYGFGGTLADIIIDHKEA